MHFNSSIPWVEQADSHIPPSVHYHRLQHHTLEDLLSDPTSPSPTLPSSCRCTGFGHDSCSACGPPVVGALVTGGEESSWICPPAARMSHQLLRVMQWWGTLPHTDLIHWRSAANALHYMWAPVGFVLLYSVVAVASTVKLHVISTSGF